MRQLDKLPDPPRYKPGKGRPGSIPCTLLLQAWKDSGLPLVQMAKRLGYSPDSTLAVKRLMGISPISNNGNPRLQEKVYYQTACRFVIACGFDLDDYGLLDPPEHLTDDNS